MTSRRDLYALGEPIGNSATRTAYGKKRIYGFGGGDDATSATSGQVPYELKPLAAMYTSQAGKIAGTPYQAYQGDRFADMNATQNLGIGMIQDRALNGSQTMGNAEQGLNQFIKGGQTNPYLDQMVQTAQQSVLGNAGALAQRSGSFGNSGIQEQALRQTGDIATQMYGNAYGQDQANKMQAIGMAPTFGNAAYQDAGQLMNAGNIQQQQAQNPLDFGYQQFQEASNYPFKQLSATGGVLGQSMGSTTTTSGGGK